MHALSPTIRFRLAAYVMAAAACIELVHAAAPLLTGADASRSASSTWGVAAALAAIAAGLGAYRAQRWAPAVFAVAALAYLGRAASVSAQVWIRLPHARGWAVVPLGAGLAFTAVALWLAWSAARAGAR